MAASQKKTQSGKKGNSSGNSRSQNPGGKRVATQSKNSTPKPIRREVGAGICLLLALFSALGYFGEEAFFIHWLCSWTKGLIGYGYYLMPPALLCAAAILAFHRGRPVRLRVWCTLLVPVVLGSLVHLFLTKEAYIWNSKIFGILWTEGKLLHSGGALAGLVAQILIAAFSRIGAGVILILLLAGCIMIVAKITPAEVVDWFRERPHPEYEEEPEKERPHRESKVRTENVESTSLLPTHRLKRSGRTSIDIPVDDGPAVEESEKIQEQSPEPEKRGFFDRKAKVPSPDQLLVAEKVSPVEEKVQEEPEVAVSAENIGDDIPPFDVEEIETVVPVTPVSAPFTRPEPPVSVSASVSVPTPPVMPEIEREPAVAKLKKGEADEAAAQISAEVAETMEYSMPAYEHPPVTLLKEGRGGDGDGVANELRANQTRLTDTIHSFGIDANIVNVTRGPAVTRYELELDQGVRLNKLTNLADDIALALGASGVRIAPIPDKISMVGIEVPNKLVSPVQIRDVISSEQFQNHDSKVAFAVGKDIGGNCIVGNIAKLPHLLIAGTTGSGKSVCTNSLIISLLYKASPEEVRLIMVDPKMVELGIYNGIPHLLIPVVTDPKKAAGALQWAVVEMMKRYRSFSEVGVRDLASYNAHAAKTEGMEKMPQIVVVIDELADLMLVAAKEVEESICRVAQMGRAAGMHLIVATQRPSADVITGLMKANIPSRIAFAVASSLESRIILDQVGAEKLVGRGDMLYLPLGAGKPTRVQGCLITDEEVSSVVEFVKRSGNAQYDESVLHEIEKSVADKEKGSRGMGGATPEAVDDTYDELLPSAIEVVVDTGMASVSMLQRRLKLGYSRAARLVDQMEEKGIVGPFEGSKPRQVLISKEQWQEMQYKQGMVDLAPDAPPISEPVPEELDYEGDAIPQPRDMPPFDMGDADF